MSKAIYFKRSFLVRTKQCRQCNKPFSTTSSVAIVHPECRSLYYASKARAYYTKTTLRNRADTRGRKRYFINEQPCEVCGYMKVTKGRKFFEEAKPGEAEGKLVEHILCNRCLTEFRLGLLEALTWNQIDIMKEAPSAPSSAPEPSSLQS